MIKGRYVAQIEVNFEYSKDEMKVTLQEVKERLHGEWIKKTITYAMEGIFKGGNVLFEVTTMYADAIQVEEEKTDE